MAEFEGIDKISTRRVSGPTLNKVIEQANRADRLRGGEGLLVGEDSIGRTISRDDLPQFTLNAATLARVVNIGDEAIPAYGVCGMVDSFFKERGPFQHERALSVRAPTTSDAGRVAIAVDEIPPNQAGLACIDGVCIVRIVRWFDLTSGSGAAHLLNKASLFAGGFNVLADVQGEFDILWEENFIGENEHLALVRFKRDFVPLKYENVGTKTIEIFQPVLLRITGVSPTTGITTAGLYQGASPLDASVDNFRCGPAYINLAGSVAVGGKGTMMVGMPGLAEIDDSVSAPVPGNPMGPDDDKQLWDHGSGNYKIMADLGLRGGKRYVAVHYDGSTWA